MNNASTTKTVMSPEQLRLKARSGEFSAPTSGQAPGYLQGNLVILPASVADDFLRFCTLNPKPCPVLGTSETGDSALEALGRNLDLRTDLPRYRLFHHGEPAESVRDISAYWREDLVGFVLGCSFSFEAAIMRAGIAISHVEAGRNVPMYTTNIQTNTAGPFGGPMVVSMRSFSPKDAIAATVISSRYPRAHGAPVHIGTPEAIGINDLMRPDFGDPPVMKAGDTPVFWACGVTPQSALARVAPDLAIVHEPGHMLVTDLLAESIE